MNCLWNCLPPFSLHFPRRLPRKPIRYRKNAFPFLPVTGGTESVLPVPAGPSGQPEKMVRDMKSRAHGESGYLRPGLVSVSGVLVIGVLTLDYRIPDLSRKRKRVNPGNSDAEYGVLLHHEIGKGNSNRRNHKSVREGTGPS